MENRFREFKEADGSSIYLKAVFGLIVVNLIAGIVAASVKAGGGGDPLNNGYFNYAVMGLMQAVNIWVVLRHVVKKRTPLTYSVKNKVWLPSLALSALSGAVCLFGFYGLAYAFDLFLNAIGYSGQVNIPFESGGEIALGVLLTVVLAPIGEELVYRGGLLSGLRKAYPWWGAMLLAGLSFSLMHMNPQQTVYQFCLGAVCAWIVMTTGSLASSMIVHAVSNLIAVLVEVTPFGGAFAGFIEAISPNGGVTAVWILLSAAAAASALFGIGLLNKKFRPKPAETAYEPEDPLLAERSLLGKRAGKLYYFMALGVCLFMWITVFVQGMMANA